MTQRHQTTC